ncbi:MAG TPA: helix-turn-helix domain-containing protein, partial [Ktedonobacterales bacterium]|nr:helix-turn-helix domain-containing protein [Ktedonobacterales bacterium]
MAADPSAPFGELLRHYRHAAGLTQSELAERAGLSWRGINDLERGVRRQPRRDTSARLAEALGLADAERAAFFAAARGAGGQTTTGPAGAQLPIAGNGEPRTPPLPTGTITFLFTDLEGSTRLLQELGTQRSATLQAEHRQLLRAAVAAHDGHEVDSQGDGSFFAFGLAPQALAAAAAAQRAVAAHTWPARATVRLRMGLHTGTAQVAGERYIGLDVHRAARIAAAGHGGQVLLSETTRALVADDLPAGLTLRELGAHRLKDLQRPERLSQLVVDGLPADFPPLATLDTHSHNLPIQPTALLGRERELANVCALLRGEGVRLLTLTGPGGTGKTRLGLQVAAEMVEVFADGVWFVGLSRLSNPDLVLPTIAQTLGVRALGSQPVAELLHEHLRGRRLLLVLDNCEQVADAAPEIANLLEWSSGLTVLATSRVALHLQGEHEYPVSPLALPVNLTSKGHALRIERLLESPAIALFVERARAHRPDFQMTAATGPA